MRLPFLSKYPSLFAGGFFSLFKVFFNDYLSWTWESEFRVLFVGLDLAAFKSPICDVCAYAYIYMHYLLYPRAVEAIPLSLSLSLAMARGMLFPARGLMMVLIVVLVLIHETCSANDSDHHCPPSSCGNIHNISYPFRLKDDPAICGDQRYTLSCENDQTVLYLYDGRYYVREINYTGYTIRIVDPGILNDNDFFIPRYPLYYYQNFSSGDPYQTRGNRYLTGVMVFVKCENPVDSRYHLNISTCFPNSSLSNSRRYIYVLLTWYSEYLGDLCQVEQITLSSRPDLLFLNDEQRDFRNISCTDFYNEQRGFEISWYQAYCGNCSYDNCFLDLVANNVTCYDHGA